MNKLLSANFARLKKDTFFRICILLMLILGIERAISSYNTMKEYQFTILLEQIFFSYTIFAAILSSVFCSRFLGTEYSDGTIRNKIIIGHTRPAVYLSNLAVCTAAGIIFCLAYIASALCVGIPLLGFFKSDPEIIFVYLGCSVILSTAIASVFTLASMLSQSKSASTAICILGIFLFFLIGTYVNARLEEPERYGAYIYKDMTTGEIIEEADEPNPHYLSGKKRECYEFIYDFLPGGQAMQISQMSAAHPGMLVLYSGVIVVFTTGFGIFFFQKENIR